MAITAQRVAGTNPNIMDTYVAVSSLLNNSGGTKIELKATLSVNGDSSTKASYPIKIKLQARARLEPGCQWQFNGYTYNTSTIKLSSSQIKKRDGSNLNYSSPGWDRKYALCGGGSYYPTSINPTGYTYGIRDLFNNERGDIDSAQVHTLFVNPATDNGPQNIKIVASVTITHMSGSGNGSSSYFENVEFIIPLKDTCYWSKITYYPNTVDIKGEKLLGPVENLPTSHYKYYGATVSLSQTIPKINVNGSYNYYRFNGWYYNNKETYGPGQAFGHDRFSTNDAKFNFYAQWEKTVFTIKLIYYDNFTKEEQVTPGNYLSLQELSKVYPRPGYKLIGWSKDKAGKELIKDDVFSPEADTTLYAQWALQSYTVKYFNTSPPDDILKYNSSSNIPNQTVIYGEEFQTREITWNYFGYKISKWFVKSVKNGTEEQKGYWILDEDGLYSFTWNLEYDVNLYAVWEKAYCTIIFDCNEGLLTNENLIEVKSKEITLHYNDCPWGDFSNLQFLNPSVYNEEQFSNNSVLTKIENTHKYSMTIRKDSQINLEEIFNKINFYPRKEDFEFYYWSNSKNELVFIENELIKITRNQNYLANWIPGKDVIFLDFNGGTINGEKNRIYYKKQEMSNGETLEAYYKYLGALINISSDIIKPGYEFIGWTIDGGDNVVTGTDDSNGNKISDFNLSQTKISSIEKLWLKATWEKRKKGIFIKENLDNDYKISYLFIKRNGNIVLI